MVGTDLSTMGGISSVLREYHKCGLMNRLNIKYLSTHKDGSRFQKFLFYLSRLPSILMEMPNREILHIHTSQGWSFRRLFVVFLFARLMGLRTIWHVHGSQFYAYFLNARNWEKWSIRYALRNADLVIALSETWKEALAKIVSKARVIVIHNAVNVDAYCCDRRERHDPVMVLFLGRLGQRKGVYDLLGAVEANRKRNLCYVLAGDGDIERVQEIVDRQALANIVTVTGWVSAQQVVELLHKADMYVLPSYDEGLPIALLEAMASGLPVISTRVGGIPEAVTDGVNGYLLEPGDIAGLAYHLKHIASDIALWKRLSANSAQRARKCFNVDHVEKVLRTIYDGL